MNPKIAVLCLMLLCLLSPDSFAQSQLDARPLDPELDPDINMFMGCWQESRPFNTHGALVERSILTKLESDDPMRPHTKGAVLINVNRLSRASIERHASTRPTTLKGEQEILYIISGEGVLKASGKSIDLREGIFALVPEAIEFTITNTADELLIMYLVSEPVPNGFTPNKEVLVKDEKAMSFRDEGFPGTHWSHNGKGIFNMQNGLATLSAITLMTFNSWTIGHPHSHDENMEEIWVVTEGDNVAFLGKEIRKQPPGMAYKIPQTGYTPHSNINVTEEPIKYLYIAWSPK